MTNSTYMTLPFSTCLYLSGNADPDLYGWNAIVDCQVKLVFFALGMIAIFVSFVAMYCFCLALGGATNYPGDEYLKSLRKILLDLTMGNEIAFVISVLIVSFFLGLIVGALSIVAVPLLCIAYVVYVIGVPLCECCRGIGSIHADDRN